MRTRRDVFRPWLLGALLLAACSDGGGGPVFELPPAPLTRGPQVALVGTTSALVAFVTDGALVAEVEYGPTLAYGSSVADPAPTADHALALTGLAPGTLYHYRLKVGGNVVTEGHSVQTVPADPAAAFRFAALADSGAGSQAQVDLAGVMEALDLDLAILAGDAVYERGAASELDRAYFLPYRALLDHVPFYVALGNHDTYADDAQTILAALHLPTNSATGTERFYSFDHGGTHFIALDSNGDLGPGSVQRAWLAGDLAAHTAATWKIAFFHHPPYSSGKQGNDPALRASLTPLFEQYGVDLVFNGHDHLYHRSFPIVADAVVDSAQEPDYTDPQGPVYVVTGGGGKSVHDGTATYFTAANHLEYHVVVVDVTGRSLLLRAIRGDGSELDRMTIRKSAP